MLKSGRELRVFPIRFDDLKGFAKEARRYGIAYAVVKQKDGESVDLLVRTEDASKVNHIAGEARPVPHETTPAKPEPRGESARWARARRAGAARPDKLRRSSMICWHRRATATPPR